MFTNLSIIPRLNYKYTIKDAALGFYGLFVKKNIINPVLTEMFKTTDILFYNHARTALRLALSSIDLPEKTGVGVIAYNCFTVFNSIEKAGYKPVFIDIKNDFRIDTEDLRKKKCKIKVLIVTHLFGIPNDIDRIKTEFPELVIIEDCAHALGSRINKKLLGTSGDFAVFSYGMAKFPSVRDGGFMIVNNKKFLPYIVEYTNELKDRTFGNEIKNILYGLVFNFICKPFVYKNITLPFLKKTDANKDYSGKFSEEESKEYQSNLHVFFNRLKYIDSYLDKQRRNGLKLQSCFCLNVQYKSIDCNYFMLPVLLDNRDEFIDYCRKNGVEIGKHFYKSIHWATMFGYKMGNCINVENMIKQIVTIPTHYNLSDKSIKKSFQIYRNYFVK